MKFKLRATHILTFAVLFALILFLAFPARYGESVKTGISLWAVSVLPATLPFLFLSALFTGLELFPRLAKAVSPAADKLFRVSGAGGCAALLSALSGYPVGARTILDLSEKGLIRRDERLRVAALATTTGPAFLVGAVGAGMYARPAVGWMLYLCHLAGVYAVSFALRFSAKKPAPVPLPPPKKLSLSDALTSSVLSVLCVGGAIAIFYAFGSMIADMGALFSLPPAAETVIRGLLEMTSGCALAAREPSAAGLAMSEFFVTFGGLCVLVQQLAFLEKAEIPVGKFLLVKLAQGGAAALFAYLFSLFLF